MPSMDEAVLLGHDAPKQDERPTLEMCFTRFKYNQKLENPWKLTEIAEISNHFFLPDK
jgi:hypothetical protein